MGAVWLWWTAAGAAAPDTDSDGVPDATDLCPAVADPAQADLDGDAIGDACDAPGLTVLGAPFAPGGSAVLTAAGVLPGEVVRFAGAPGRGGNGPCVGPVCLDLGAHAVDLGSAVAGPSGVARRTIGVPASLGAAYAVQAVVVRGARSAVSAIELLDGQVLDHDGDGFADAGDVCPEDPDPDQSDVDGNGIGDACELLAGPAWAVAGPVVHFGEAPVAGIGDVNGDGWDDVAVGDSTVSGAFPYEGRVDVYLGSALGLPAGPSWSFSGGQDRASLGGAVAGAGDVNGDGYDDLVVGAPGWDGTAGVDEGRVLLFLGSPAGLGAAPAWTASGGGTTARLGTSVAGAGDVNGDGHADLVAGAPGWDGAATDQGKVALWLGSAGGPPAAPSWWATDTGSSSFGARVAAAGDVDGDGYDDLLLAAPGYEANPSLTSEGRVDLYLGGPANPTIARSWAGNVARAGLGWDLGGIGDVNGDGHDDVMIVASGGDGDLFGPTTPGWADVYLGGPGGVVGASVWRQDWSEVWISRPVTRVGDVDEDGYDDLLVAEPEWGTPWKLVQGRVRLYPGGPTGPATSATWTAVGAEADVSLGAAAAGAGDVDGDGHVDLLLATYGAGVPEVRLYTGNP